MMRTLFNTGNIHDVKQFRFDMIRTHVDTLTGDEFVSGSKVEEHIESIVDRWTLRVPDLTHEIVVESHEEVRNHKSEQRIVFDVPFTGDRELLYFSPSQVQGLPPRPVGHVLDNYVSFHVVGGDLCASDVMNRMRETMRALTEYLSLLKEQCAPWNAKLADDVRALVEARRDVLIRQRKVIEELLTTWPDGVKVHSKNQAA